MTSLLRAYLHRPKSLFLRRVLFQVHLWVGVAAGVYIFVVSTTGAALVFRIDLQRAHYPQLFTPGDDGPPAEPATLLENLQRAYPQYRVSGIDAPTTTRPTYLAYVTDGPRFRTVLLDPVTASVLGELPERSAIRTLQDLHFDLLAGRTGRLVNGVGAACLFAMCVTGLVIWWQGANTWRRGFAVDVRRNWKRVNWDLHSAIGAWTLAFLTMWSVTGIAFAFPRQFRTAVNAVSPLTVVRAPQSDPRGAGLGPRPTGRTLIERARQRMPDQFVARVVVPANDRGAFQVTFSPVKPTPVGATNLPSVYLDQFTGAVLAAPTEAPRTAGDMVMKWVAPLHVGSFGPTGLRLAWAVLGLSPALLFVTGLLMWWSRVVRARG
ncbi:MAG: PepSY-associated TM helix domain-containing protein [Acidobacteriota bacterium]